MSPALQNIVTEGLKIAAPVLVTALGAALTWGAAHLASWLRSKAAGSKAFNVVATFGELASSLVAKLEAELRPEIQFDLEDGKLSPQEAQHLRDHALSALKAAAPAELKDAAEKLFGASGLDTWLSGLIERAVAKLPPSTPPTPAPAPDGSTVSAGTASPK